ncbi:MAG: hypothetical protein J4473_02410 [Candidatus Aenigmarchaeota archaeon]|nr:hypothetical protein [Candidatus Aenigmarchaeota archaeon]
MSFKIPESIEGCVTECLITNDEFDAYLCSLYTKNHEGITVGDMARNAIPLRYLLYAAICDEGIEKSCRTSSEFTGTAIKMHSDGRIEVFESPLIVPYPMPGNNRLFDITAGRLVGEYEYGDEERQLHTAWFNLEDINWHTGLPENFVKPTVYHGPNIAVDIYEQRDLNTFVINKPPRYGFRIYCIERTSRWFNFDPLSENDSRNKGINPKHVYHHGAFSIDATVRPDYVPLISGFARNWEIS